MDQWVHIDADNKKEPKKFLMPQGYPRQYLHMSPCL